MDKNKAIEIIKDNIDFLKMIINYEGIDDEYSLIEALVYITNNEKEGKNA